MFASVGMSEQAVEAYTKVGFKDFSHFFLGYSEHVTSFLKKVDFFALASCFS